MIVSLNEIETAAYRAALGVGLDHGLAQDAGAIAVKLVPSRPDGLAILLRALNFADANRIAPPVFVREGQHFRPRHAVLPSLVAGPIAADLRRAEPDAAVDTSRADEPAIVELCLSPPAGNAPDHGVAVTGGLWQDLQRLAARTYVPASETSRLMGAGAGLRDTD